MYAARVETETEGNGYCYVIPVPCCGVLICSKYPPIIAGRRHRLPHEIGLAPLRSEGIGRASKQQIPDFSNIRGIRQAPRVSDP